MTWTFSFAVFSTHLHRGSRHRLEAQRCRRRSRRCQRRAGRRSNGRRRDSQRREDRRQALERTYRRRGERHAGACEARRLAVAAGHPRRALRSCSKLCAETVPATSWTATGRSGQRQSSRRRSRRRRKEQRDREDLTRRFRRARIDRQSDEPARRARPTGPRSQGEAPEGTTAAAAAARMVPETPPRSWSKRGAETTPATSWMAAGRWEP